jgi:hypothetical protein
VRVIGFQLFVPRPHGVEKVAGQRVLAQRDGDVAEKIVDERRSVAVRVRDVAAVSGSERVGGHDLSFRDGLGPETRTRHFVKQGWPCSRPSEHASALHRPTWR